jgi:hypothetical protein
MISVKSVDYLAIAAFTNDLLLLYHSLEIYFFKWKITILHIIRLLYEKSDSHYLH